MKPITSTPKAAMTTIGTPLAVRASSSTAVPSPIAPSTPSMPNMIDHDMFKSPPITHVNGMGAARPTTTADSRIKIELDNEHLWRQFATHTTEMIVTKSGRRMFPTLRYQLSGMEPSGTYAIMLDMAPTDDARYKFQNGAWVVAGRAEPSHNYHNARVHTHPDSPQSGSLWMRQPLSFSRIKLTNNQGEPHNHVLLNSMHKYSPRVYVMRLNEYYPSVPQMVAQAHFAHTQFVAVTAYQNDNVIKLKINHNPFAKGFRESAASGVGEKRRHAHAFETSQPMMSTMPTYTALLAQQLMRLPLPPSSTMLPSASSSNSVLVSPPNSTATTRSTASIDSNVDAEKTTPPQAPKRTKIWNPFLTPPQPSTSPPAVDTTTTSVAMFTQQQQQAYWAMMMRQQQQQLLVAHQHAALLQQQAAGMLGAVPPVLYAHDKS